MVKTIFDPRDLTLEEGPCRLHSGALPPRPVLVEEGPERCRWSAWPSTGCSALLHALVVFIAVGLSSAPELPVQVIGIALLPSKAALREGGFATQAPVTPPHSVRETPPTPVRKTSPSKTTPRVAGKTPKPAPGKRERGTSTPPVPSSETVRVESVADTPLQNENTNAGIAATVAAVSTEANPALSGRGGQAAAGLAGPIQGSFGDADGPRFVQRVLPRYPALARRKGWEGLVVLRLTIGPEGELKAATVVEGDRHGFGDAALEAAKASRYAPATRNGHGVECSALLPVRFALKGG